MWHGILACTACTHKVVTHGSSTACSITSGEHIISTTIRPYAMREKDELTNKRLCPTCCIGAKGADMGMGNMGGAPNAASTHSAENRRSGPTHKVLDTGTPNGQPKTDGVYAPWLHTARQHRMSPAIAEHNSQ